tara:strand:- start:15824 stop:16501 length:678 start_codon:yes stop_codon:yes gene_type:complete
MARFNKDTRAVDAEKTVAFSARRNASYTNVVLSIALGTLLILIWFLVRATTVIFPKAEFVYTSNAAAVCTFEAVDERGEFDDAMIRDYAARIAMELHALDFVNYRSTLARVTDSQFTPEARVAAAEALRSSGILRVVIDDGYILRALPRDIPVIERQGVVSGVYQWVVRVPLVFAYTSRSNSGPSYRPENRDVTLTLIRTEQTASNPRGILVSGLSSTQPIEEHS